MARIWRKCGANMVRMWGKTKKNGINASDFSQIMNNQDDLLKIIEQHSGGLTLSDLIKGYPNIPRRTAQRWILGLIA